MGRSFNARGPDGAEYIRYFFPGALFMILLFTAMFSTISIIDDRNEGFLQSVLVSPIRPGAIVLGKLLGGTLLAFGQALLFLLLGPLIGIHLDALSLLLACGFLLAVGFSLTGLGFCIAWRMNSTQGFHAMMNLLLMPMWFLSGALFPATGAMKWVMAFNPLTYGLAGLRRSLYWNVSAGDLPGFAVCAGVTILFAAVIYLLAGAIWRGRVAADLQ
jgi:ABC-2 type transport system permease protein